MWFTRARYSETITIYLLPKFQEMIGILNVEFLAYGDTEQHSYAKDEHSAIQLQVWRVTARQFCFVFSIVTP
jgi:hypothetical protein